MQNEKRFQNPVEDPHNLEGLIREGGRGGSGGWLGGPEPLKLLKFPLPQ